MAQDPYSVLGVGRQASSDDIRKAYRKLAKQYHPDRNRGDTKAEERFKAVNAAFEIIGDEQKRRRYNAGEIDADGNERMTVRGGGSFRQRPGAGGAGAGAGAAGGNFDEFSDLFADFFGNRGGPAGGGRPRPTPQKGQDIRYRLSVDFLEAARGVTKRVSLPDSRTIDVTIPEGLRDGQTLRLKGQGGAGMAGGPPGDVLVEVTVKPHSVYSVNGDHLTLEVPVTLKEAVLGGRIEIPTLRGPVVIKLPPNTSSGVAFRLREKGLRNPKTGKVGDLFAKTRIVLPDIPDGSLEEFVRSWDAEEQNPRGTLNENAA